MVYLLWNKISEIIKRPSANAKGRKLRGSTFIVIITEHNDHSLDDNGITGPDWGRSEGGAQRFVNGKVSAVPFLSVDAVKAAVPRQSFFKLRL